MPEAQREAPRKQQKSTQMALNGTGPREVPLPASPASTLLRFRVQGFGAFPQLEEEYFRFLGFRLRFRV